ncbi:MAG TPA: tRNA pseudouridine(38-40) synthase TruA [Armatimonadota bacterium]|nr:tRNA pseudouridine(38-40) synthase TruA [Armatimonadota bacterium]
MRNIKLLLEYDGTDFHGFQRQRHLRTVQGVLEDCFSRLLDETIKITGAGRTDAGVHALGQVVNFHTTRPIGADRLGRVLNAALPDDVKIRQSEEVDAGFHSRRCARTRTYRYTVIERPTPSPMLGRFALVVPDRLDPAAMKRAARPLLGRHDFRAFQASGSETATTERTLLRLDCRRRAEYIEITAEADSFLYRMVRNLAAALIEVGRGQLAAGALAEALTERRRLPKCPPAPSCGLCLVQVSY